MDVVFLLEMDQNTRYLLQHFLLFFHVSNVYSLISPFQIWCVIRLLQPAPPYTYGYEVSDSATGNRHGHRQQTTGKGVTKGRYNNIRK